MGRKRVAIVGSGCSGLGALWALKSTDYEVHLYEAGDRLGGHTNTTTFRHGNHETQVDTGFIVMNSSTYPNLISFLKELEVKTVPTEMTFGVSRDAGLFEWAGTSLSGIFAQRANLLRPAMWRMIFDIIRFNQFALDLLHEEEEDEGDPSEVNGLTPDDQLKGPQKSVGEYLEQEGYSESFRDDYLIPMTAAVWSTSPDKVSLDFPVITLVRFLWNHHLLNTISARPQWMTLENFSKSYIDAVMKAFPRSHVHLATAVSGVDTLSNGQVKVSFANEGEDTFDHVVLATHGDQALEIIRGSATEHEMDVLGGFKTSKNVAVLHSDLDLMPKRRKAWTSWNYITKSSDTSSNVNQVCLTYWMNLLQHIPSSTFGPVLVTLNPLFEPKPELTQGRWDYNHPLYNTAAIRSQSLLPSIQNKRGISYAGAWTKYGFHEDGFSSGLKVAVEHLGATLPFEFVDSTFSRGRKPVLQWRDHTLRAALVILQLVISQFSLIGAIFGAAQPTHQQQQHLKKTT